MSRGAKPGVSGVLRQPGAAEAGPWARARRAAAWAATAFLLATVAWFVWLARHWPLVNDAALMHYVVFLAQHGMAPYRQIGDINLPGAYLPEWVSLTLAGFLHVSRAAMWRGMDALALLLAGWAMVSIARPYGWFAGVFAGCLLALYHGRDGIGQAGQRDLWLAMLALWAIALLFKAMRADGRAAGWRVFGFGLLLGAATTIKPFGAGYLLCLLPLLLWQRGWRPRLRLLAWVGAGFGLPLLSAGLWVLHWHAAAALWRVLRVDLPYHASLADGSVRQLLSASSLAMVRRLLVLMGLCALARGGWRASVAALHTPPAGSSGWAQQPQRLLLALCVLLGVAAFVVQGKGYSYQRYPYIAFLLLLAGLEFGAAVRSRQTIARALGTAGFAYGVLLCAPAYLRAAAQAPWPTPVLAAMSHALQSEAGPTGLPTLNGQVQCIDAVSGCTDVLLHLRLVQVTGTLYDEFLFPQTPAPWGTAYTGPAAGAALPRAVAQARQRFQSALQANSPRVFLVSSWLFLEGPGDYAKLKLWPWFDSYLSQHYRLVSQQSFPRAENGPMGFRLYVRREPARQTPSTIR